MPLSRLRQSVAAHGRARVSLAVLGALVLACISGLRAPLVSGAAPEVNLTRALAHEGLTLQPGDVVWLAADPGPFRRRPAVLRAHEGQGLSDLYYAEVRATSSGAILDIAWLTNLTRTSAADEGRPVRLGWYLAYATRAGERFSAVSVWDLRGQAKATTAGWPLRARMQQRISNLEEAGRARGIGRVRYDLSPPAESVALRVRGEQLELQADGREIRIRPGTLTPLQGAEYVRGEPEELGQPGGLTWVVDTVRGLSFVGPEPIAWLEHRVYRAKDRLDRLWYGAVGTDTDSDVTQDLGVTVEERRRRIALNPPEPELGLPPAPLDPLVGRPAEGEGAWLPVTDDPFVRTTPNAPPAFYQTFLQVDPDRPFTRVYIVLWDPRQVQLRVMSGTREPESATGETGPGRVPRDDFTLRHMVGGFNGGFQSIHGEFGMMVQGRVYLPPKPWAATVAVYDDGVVAVGSWRDPPEGETEFREDWATAQIPDSMVDMRQNLTSVVEGDRYNPWRRWWWGAAPVDAEEQVFMDRSGVCLTREGFMAYFWGTSMGADELGAAMLKVRCVRGIHLDMNQRHTAFEYYDVHGKDEPFAPLGRRRSSMEFELPVGGAEGYVMRGRKAVSSMTPMRFPRYMRRDQRDFFYLTLKPVLPGPDLLPEEPGGSGQRFSTDGLPRAEWPYAFARVDLGPAEGPQTYVIRVDPRRAQPTPLAHHDHGRPLGYFSQPEHASAGRHGLYAVPLDVGYHFEVGEAPAGAEILLRGRPLAQVPDALAALGVTLDGFLVYAEQGAPEAPDLAQALARAGAVGEVIALQPATRLAFAADGETAVGPDRYQRTLDIHRALVLEAQPRAATEVLFPDVQPRPYMYWYRMQDTRVRYLREEDHAPRFRAPDGGV